MRLSPLEPGPLDPAVVTRRRMRVATFVLVLTLPAVLFMADLHWRSGFDVWKALHLTLFTVLFALLAFGVVQAWLGWRLRKAGGDPLRIIQTLAPEDDAPLSAPTAVIMPICNEDVSRVMKGVQAVYESLLSEGRLTDCDFYILSDSPDPNNWVEEEAAWLALVRKLNAHGRLFYRKRKGGINKKAGNVADFCRRWGSQYRYMVVLDADSIMSGKAVTTLVRLMERNPRVGLIQAVPALVNGETIFARVQQFASRLYGPIFSAGLNYWQLGEANYWGHNAIIRTAPFIRHCSLPELPGDGPFGGRILSHDYVEAALMRRAGWQVWLATDVAGNYEECPANLVDFAKRDRRWLQGNLQHARLIVARGFHAVNRLHFTLGILSYLASPLWFILVMLSCLIAYRATSGAVTAVPGTLPWSFNAQAIALFFATVSLLLAPKVFALLDLRRRPAELSAFGGWSKVGLGIFSETLIFTLIAPILMLFHTKFVVLTLCRQTISWGTQRRGRAGAAAWAEAFSAHFGQTVFGVALTFFAVRLSPGLAWWMSPLLAGMVLSIPLSFVTGSFAVGEHVRRWGIFATPEETTPPPELRRFTEILAAPVAGRLPPAELENAYGLLQAALDPFVNAVHVSLLRAKDSPPVPTEQRLLGLRERLLAEGPLALNVRDRIALLSDADSMASLHEELWATPSAQLGEWWRLALAHYQIVGQAPQTAFSN